MMKAKGKVIVTGATGFIGRRLCRELVTYGYEVIALSRNPQKARDVLGPAVSCDKWDGRHLGDWVSHLEGAYGVINLAGENVGDSKWTKEKKKRILNSRLDAIDLVIKAFSKVKDKPRVLIQASAMGYYGNRGDEVLKENARPGNEFLSDVVVQCEDAAKKIEQLGVRLVLLRTSLVLGADGGALPRMMQNFKMYTGGIVGSGKDWISWIHIDDEVKAIRFLLERDDLDGPFNLSSPSPVRSKEVYELLGNVMKKPSWLATPSFVIKAMLGERGKELLLSSKRLDPDRLLKAGFKFRFPVLETALKNLI